MSRRESDFSDILKNMSSKPKYGRSEIKKETISVVEMHGERMPERDWLVDVATEVGREFKKHNMQFALIPMQDYDEVENNVIREENGVKTVVSTCQVLTDCKDPRSFALSIMGAISSFCGMDAKKGLENDAAIAMTEVILDTLKQIKEAEEANKNN